MTGSELYNKRLRQFKEDVGLYPVSCEELANGRSDREWLDAVLAAGARIVQLRDKKSEDRVLLEKARYFREKTNESGALFLINDRVDIAMLTQADGLHLGQQDLPASEVRRLVPEMLIGVSCNQEEDVMELGRQEKQNKLHVDYYNIGPLYTTGTKEGLKQFIGSKAIAAFSKHCSLPFTVMGGIKLEHIDALKQSGAKRIAVVTAITKEPDMELAARRLIEKIGA